jgi:hypothetical protein
LPAHICKLQFLVCRNNSLKRDFWCKYFIKKSYSVHHNTKAYKYQFQNTWVPWHWNVARIY